jgi:hypothetical protein
MQSERNLEICMFKQSVSTHASSPGEQENDTSRYLEESHVLLLFAGRLAGVFVVVLSVCWVVFAAYGQKAYAKSLYNCPPAGMHCYGVEIWPNQVLGAQTSISVVHLAPGNGFVTNEEWLMEDDAEGTFWVEAGYLVNSQVDNGTELWFWADYRPSDSNINDHYAATGISSSDYGNNVNITIQSGTNTLGTSWTVQVFGNATGIEGTSTHNSMIPTQIEIGQELAGSSGVSAPRAIFEYNTWRGKNSPVGSFQYQTSDGDGIQAQDPPYAGWYDNHDPKSYVGGQMYTCSPTSC